MCARFACRFLSAQGMFLPAEARWAEVEPVTVPIIEVIFLRPKMFQPESEVCVEGCEEPSQILPCFLCLGIKVAHSVRV